MARNARARKHTKHYKATRPRPRTDILPSATRPVLDRPMLPRDRRATHCQHGVSLEEWCERCERREITAAIDTQLAR